MNSPTRATPGTIPEEAARLHQESLVIDGLNASWFLERKVLERLHRGGVTGANATIAAWHNPTETLAMLGDVLQLFRDHSDLVLQVKSVADIRRAKEMDRVGLILGFQDTEPLGDNIRLLNVYQAVGVRIIQLTYNFENRVGFGCQAPEDQGLKPFGREVVAEMNRLGLLIDLSHCGERTTREAIELSEKPVAITHANSKATLDHPRNKSDEVIQALAARGGVIGAVAVPAMLTRDFPATLDDYLDAIDYLVQLVGVDHVGLGPDFMEEMPQEVIEKVLVGLPPETMRLLASIPPTQGLESVARLPNVTAGLLERGYRPEDVRKILGENWLRLYREVWGA